jgi:hypothetical protein
MLFIVEVDGGRIALVDGENGVELAIADGVAVPANTRALLAAAADSEGIGRVLLCDGEGKLKVAAQPPTAPPGTTEFVLAQPEAELEVGPVPTFHETVSAAIPDGENLYLQTFVVGASGDPSEKGSKVEIYWREGATPTDHLISRIYLQGQTVVQTLSDVNKARDGTTLTGDAGGTTKLVIRRERLSTSAAEIDAEVRGYTK